MFRQLKKMAYSPQITTEITGTLKHLATAYYARKATDCSLKFLSVSADCVICQTKTGRVLSRPLFGIRDGIDPDVEMAIRSMGMQALEEEEGFSPS